MNSLWASIMDKILSARFLITVFIGITYCKMVNHCVYFYLESMKADPSKMEAFVNGLTVGFSGLAVLVIKSYFDRADRPNTTISSSTPNPTPVVQATQPQTTINQPEVTIEEKAP